MKHFVLLFSLWFISPIFAKPLVVTSIKPLTDWVQAIGGKEIEVYPLSNTYGGHDLTLKPSDRRMLEKASLIVWIGEAMEGNLERTLSQLPAKIKVLKVSELHGMHIISETGYQNEEVPSIDPHLWLDPENARIAIREITTLLIELAPEKELIFIHNQRKFIKALDEIEKTMAEEFAPLKNEPLFSYHNSLSYLAKRLMLNYRGAVTDHLEVAPSPHQVMALKNELQTLSGACFVIEPEIPKNYYQNIIEDTQTNLTSIDILGQKTNSYLATLEEIRDLLAACLMRSQHTH